MDKSEPDYVSLEKYHIYIFCGILEEISSAILELKFLKNLNREEEEAEAALHLRRLLEILPNFEH